MAKKLAHISEDHSREQTVYEHLTGTAELAKQFAAAFGAEEDGYLLGLLHDIGKYIVPAHVKNIYIPGDAYVYGTLVVENNPGVRIFGRGTLLLSEISDKSSYPNQNIIPT